MSASLHINGAWLPGQGTSLPLADPCTGQETGKLDTASPRQCDAALRAARAAFPAWAARPPGERVSFLEKYAALLERDSGKIANLISLETGKPPWEAASEASAIRGKIPISIRAQGERCSSFGKAPARTRFRPHGVALIIGPFNFPGHLPNGHLVPALLAGNTLVIKPSPHTPRTLVHLVRLLGEAGLPPGVVNLVQGHGSCVASRLVSHPEPDAIFFTGSSRTGKLIATANAERPGRLLALEMGGNNPLLVTAAPDPGAACLAILQSAFLTAGQRCTCARRLILVENATTPALLDCLLHATRALRVGPPRSTPEPFCGPLIPPGAAREILDAQNMLIAKGGIPLLKAAPSREEGNFLTPGLIDMTGASERPDTEIFGPLLQIVRLPSLQAAIAEANRTRYGLSAGLLSPDPAEYETFRLSIRAGIVNWNHQLTGASSASPFGGTGDSGNHRPSAYFAADYCNRPVASLEKPSLGKPASLPPGLPVTPFSS